MVAEKERKVISRLRKVASPLAVAVQYSGEALPRENKKTRVIGNLGIMLV